jgi:hypothetical protein
VIQSSVPWDRRGSVTALSQFSRTIGGAVGVAAMGILFQARLRAVAADQGWEPRVAANPLQPGLGAASRQLVAAGVEAVFWVLLLVALATLLTTLVILVRRRAGAELRGEAAG